MSSLTVSEQGHYEEKLIDDIFHSRMYNKLARPVKNESEALSIRFGVSLQQIIDVVRAVVVDRGCDVIVAVVAVLVHWCGTGLFMLMFCVYHNVHVSTL